MGHDICWVETIDEADASEALAKVYDQLRRDDGTVHNLYKAFSQFPQVTISADRHYRDLMHAPDAPLPKWLAELISVQVAILARCDYALAHHGSNFVHLYEDREKARAMIDALKAGDWNGDLFDVRLRAILTYGEKLTRHPDEITGADMDRLRDAGLNDAEISQVVQVSAGFAYWVRVINGLGIKLGDEKIGKYG